MLQAKAISENKYAKHHQKYLEFMQASLSSWGPDCFDFGYYQSKNSLEEHLTAESLWHHFVHKGQFLDLPFRYSPMLSLCIIVLEPEQ